jgi:hypothetical protein
LSKIAFQQLFYTQEEHKMNFTINVGGWIGIALVIVLGIGVGILSGAPEAAAKAIIPGMIIVGGLCNSVWTQFVKK